MDELKGNLSLMLSGAAIIGIIFNIYKSYRVPQETSEKQQIANKAELDNKASLLAQQLQWEKEANERRFKDVNEAQLNATTLAQNHIHTVDTKVDGLIAHVGTLNTAITRLETIINERLPKQ